MQTKKKVLLLGAGFVAKPALELLSTHGCQIIVGSVDLDASRNLCHGFIDSSFIHLDVNHTNELDAAIRDVDIVVSLIPYTLHALVIKSAIRMKKNVVTSSYIAPSMAELDSAAKENGILVLNECGLDPGIDQLLAIETIKDVHDFGGSITSLRSYCGALPAPECADNPLGYKFSWSPRGVLLALKNPAKFFLDGSVQDIPGSDLMNVARPFHNDSNLDLVSYPNRDATTYRDRYGIPEAETVIRSTVRYERFLLIVQALTDVGFLEDQHLQELNASNKRISWRDLTCIVTNVKSSKESHLEKAILDKIGSKPTQEQRKVIDAFRWMGLFSDDEVPLCGTPLDALCSRLELVLEYELGARDMVILQHDCEIQHKNGDIEQRTITLTEFGDPNGHSALARLVGVTCASAALKALDGTISGNGIRDPLDWSIAGPLLRELKALGVSTCTKSTMRTGLSAKLA